jgi:hypothetical protein
MDGMNPTSEREYTDVDEELAMANARLKEAEALLRRWVESVERGRTDRQNVLANDTEAWL